MREKILWLSLLLFFISFASVVHASGFQIKTIGVLDVDGVNASHLWYTNGNTTITGITTAYSEVEISVDGSSQKINADSSGGWIFHANLSDGDHNLIFTSNSSSITRTLTIGKNLPTNLGTLPKAETPTVGNLRPTLMFLTLGGLLLFLSPLFYLRKNKA